MTRIMIIFFLLFLSFREVHADEVYKEAYLSCDTEKNTAMVRFEAGWMGKPRQIKFYNEYSKYEYLNNLPLMNECLFKDGRKIILSHEKGQAFGYGQGGGDPPAYFNLKVGDKYAYYHKGFYTAFGSEFADPLVIILSDKILVSCKGPNGFSDDANYAEQYIKNDDCTDESQRLVSGVENFRGELNALKENQSQDAYIQISKYSELCKFIKEHNVYDLAGTQTQSFFSNKQTPFGSVSEGILDINNDGKVDSILQFASTNHYLDGQYLVVSDKSTADSIMKCVLEKKCPPKFPVHGDGSANVDEFVETITQYWPSSYALSGKDLSDLGYRTRYTSLYPVNFLSKNYIYFEPLNDTSFPRAAVGEVHPDKKVDLLCTYKRIPNGR